ncbi:MAG: hypothetical protein AAB782_00355, partial [Patescibacteria group bacterium]
RSAQDPRASSLVVNDADAVVAVEGIRRPSLYEEPVATSASMLGGSQSRKESEIEQLVRELHTHRAPPSGILRALYTYSRSVLEFQ